MLLLLLLSRFSRVRLCAPTRLPCPWDSPGKNTGVGCHFLLQCVKVKSESEVTQSCPTLSDPMDYSPPGPPSMGFSRQEYWSGVPLPSLLLSCLVWSWLFFQGASVFYFMAAVTICIDFRAPPPNKVTHFSHCFPIYLP